MRSFLLQTLLLLALTCSARAEVTREAAARLGVDVVQAKGGREARGSIVERREGNGVTIAVRRAWLESKEPAWLVEIDAAAESERQAALETLVTRIQEWQATRVKDERLAALVTNELKEFERRLNDKEAREKPEQMPSEFVLIEIPEDQVRRVYEQPHERKQAALVAWRERLENVESASVDKLHKQLEARMIDWQTTTVDLSDRLPKLAVDDQREWAARTAIYEYAFQQRLEFQGTGDFVVRTGNGAAPPAGDLLAGLLQGQVGGDVATLLQGALGGEGAIAPQKQSTWLDTSSRIAEAEDARGFHVTRTAQDVVNKTVTVEDRFVARMPDGTWETIWLASTTLDATKERRDLADRIRQDQQVGEVLKLVQDLGLGGQVDTALQFGAATMEAQETMKSRFAEFTGRYSERLDGPALKWNAGAQKE